jgi:hypothetical protein
MRVLSCLLLFLLVVPVIAQEDADEDDLRERVITLSTSVAPLDSFVSTYSSTSSESVELSLEELQQQTTVVQTVESTRSIALGDTPYGRGSITATVTETGGLEVTYEINAEMRYVDETLYIKPTGSMTEADEEAEAPAFFSTFDDTWRVVLLDTEEAIPYENLNLDSFTGVLEYADEGERLSNRVVDFLDDANTITDDATVINGRQTEVIRIGFSGEDVITFLQDGGVFVGEDPVSVNIREQLSDSEDEALSVTLFIQNDRIIGRELSIDFAISVDPQLLDATLPPGGTFTLTVNLTEREILSNLNEPIPLVGAPQT